MDFKDYSMLDLIGNTPLVRLKNIEKAYHLFSPIYAKLERCNPTGSIKDRIAKEMILSALKEGKINQDTLIIEPTSGNTGIGLSAICASLGMKAVIFMPASCSKERVQMMAAFGADCRLVKEGGMAKCIEEAEKLHQEVKNSFIPLQFENPANSMAHYKTTGPEIWNDTDGQVDAFVAGVGTGGTVTGVGQFLKSKNSNVKVVAVEPASSPVLSKGTAGAHKIQGIGAGFIPDVLDTKVYDEIIAVENEDAFKTGKLIGKKEGVLVGISSGAATWAAIELAKRPENAGKKIVVLLPDTGDRYLSTPLFTD